MSEREIQKGLATYVTKTLIVECDHRDVINIRSVGDEDEGEGAESAA